VHPKTGWVPKPLNAKARERLQFESGLDVLAIYFLFTKKSRIYHSPPSLFHKWQATRPAGRESTASRRGPGLRVSEFGGLE